MLALPPAFLTLPAPGASGFAALRRKLLLLALRRLLAHPTTGLDPALARSLPRLRHAASESARRHGAAFLELLASPDVLAPLLCLEAGVRSADEMLAQAGPQLLAAMAQARMLDEGLIWQAPVRRVILGERMWEGEARALAALPGGVELELATGERVDLAALPGSMPFHPLRHGVSLSLVDTNPLAMLEAHPDKAGNSLDLGGRSPAEWQSTLLEALDLVELGLPEWTAELRLSLRRLVPVGYLPEVHLSASYREAPFLAYLTLHPNRVTLAEAIVHETQHGRLNVLSWLDPILHNGWTEWTDSPVRPDLRPLMGVLLAVHAFVPVAALHARLAAVGHPLAQGPDFEHRRAQVLAGNARGLDILEAKADPTAAGRRLLVELRQLHDHLAALAPELPAAPEALPPG